MIKNSKAIEYQMTKTAFQEMLKVRTPDEMKLNPYAFVMKVINDTYNLRGTVKRINLV